MRVIRLFFAIIALQLSWMAGAEPLVDASDPKSLLEIAKGFGSATLETDSQGDPIINGRINGTRYSIQFYSCQDNKDCKTINFVAYFRAGDDRTPEQRMAQVNRWNNEKIFGSAYIDTDGDYAIDMAVNLAFGITAKNFDDTVDYWRLVLQQFEEFLREEHEGPAGPQNLSV